MKILKSIKDCTELYGIFKKTSRQKDKLSSDTNVDINKASRILIFILISILEVLCTVSGTRHLSLMPSSTVYFSDSIFSYIKKKGL